MKLLLAGNDTVPISVWRDRGMRSTKCRLAFLKFLKLSITFSSERPELTKHIAAGHSVIDAFSAIAPSYRSY